jgi:hypothetical protein
MILPSLLHMLQVVRVVSRGLRVVFCHQVEAEDNENVAPSDTESKDIQDDPVAQAGPKESKSLRLHFLYFWCHAKIPFLFKNLVRVNKY